MRFKNKYIVALFYIAILLLSCKKENRLKGVIAEKTCIKENDNVYFNDTIVGSIDKMYIDNNQVLVDILLIKEINFNVYGIVNSKDLLNQTCYLELKKTSINTNRDTILVFNKKLDTLSAINEFNNKIGLFENFLNELESELINKNIIDTTTKK